MVRTYYTDREAAREEVAALTQWTVNPTLTVIEIYDLIDRAQRCSFWSASTEYTAGELIMPATFNGHHYICMGSGTSGTTEPIWSVSRLFSVTNDSDAIWVENGIAFSNIFDIREAVYRGWMLKAAKASREIDVTLAGGASAGTF